MLSLPGIVHLAGTTHGDAEMLCREPLKYPVFLSAVVPLYLSVMASYRRACPATHYPVSATCSQAVKSVVTALASQQGQPIPVTYSAGRGKFTWPPPAG